MAVLVCVQGRQVPVAQIPCVDDGTTTKFIDRHNGWGLSALHIAVFQGSVSTGGLVVVGEAPSGPLMQRAWQRWRLVWDSAGVRGGEAPCGSS